MANEPSRWAPIEKVICEFQGLLAPTVPQFKIERGVDCAESCPTRKTASPPLQKYGVYLVFDDSESLRYIGSTIDRKLIARCLEHRKSERFIKRFKFTPRWIDVIPLDWGWVFFAPSLELYLISKITFMKGDTLVNQRGRRMDVDDF